MQLAMRASRQGFLKHAANWSVLNSGQLRVPGISFGPGPDPVRQQVDKETAHTVSGAGPGLAGFYVS